MEKRKEKVKKNISNVIETVEITNPDKIIFDKQKITKKDIVLYYQKVYNRMFPYLKNRLISTIRCPEGINGECFFKKHLGIYNKGIGMVEVLNEKGEREDYYFIKDISGLIAEAQMNTIEFHIWGSTIKKLDKPDMLVFDLDPDEKLDLQKVRQGVRDLKSILDELSLISFLKTSGGKGYHIVIPIKPSINWDKFRQFAKNIAEIMETKWPGRYTSNVRKVNRKNKIFVDWIRNIKGATSVAPYSLRIKDKATVSMPIKWSELDKITPYEITMKEALKRMGRKDPWANFFKIKQELK